MFLNSNPQKTRSILPNKTVLNTSNLEILNNPKTQNFQQKSTQSKTKFPIIMREMQAFINLAQTINFLTITT